MADEVIYRGYNEEIDVNMVPGGPMSVWHSSQYDELRKLRVNLYNGKALQYLGSGVTVSLSVRKNDGNIIESSSSDVIKIVEENPWGEGSAPWRFIEINTTQQMTACVGKNTCEIVVYETVSGETSRVGSANFILEVERDPLAGGIQSDSEIDDLQEMVEEAMSETGLNGLGDVNIDSSTVTMNDGLLYNARTGKWENSKIALGKLYDVTITNPHNGQILRYDSTAEEWVNVYENPIPVQVIMVPANATSFNVNYNVSLDGKNINVYRDSYLSAPPTDIGVIENGNTTIVTVSFEAVSNITYWKVEVV